MSLAGTAALGAVAGLTILLGLPVARIGRPSSSRMAFLTSASVGVLLFIFFDVVKNAADTVEVRLDDSRPAGAAFALLLAAGLAVGLLGLVVFEHLVMRRRRRGVPSGPGALAAGDVALATTRSRAPLDSAVRVALLIAGGIGLHNFSEGLAIGQSAAAGVYRLFALLVIGFGLHNITEGFGVTAPLIGRRPSWRLLGLLGLVGGGPTFLGTLVGYGTTSALGPGSTAMQAVSVAFLALAAGAILYVIGELQHAGRKLGAHDVAMVGLLTGFLAGYSTDLLLHAAGA